MAPLTASNNNVATAEVFTFNSTPSAASAAPSIYSNLASPFPLASPCPVLLPMTPFSPPPSVNRTLKPKLQAGQVEGVAPPPPTVNRQLKPNRECAIRCGVSVRLLNLCVHRSRVGCRSSDGGAARE